MQKRQTLNILIDMTCCMQQLVYNVIGQVGGHFFVQFHQGKVICGEEQMVEDLHYNDIIVHILYVLFYHVGTGH